MRRLRLLLGILLLLTLPSAAWAQAAKAKVPVMVRGQTSQNSLKVDNSVTPNVTEIGCETDQENTATVNGLTLQGSATTVNVAIKAKACTGGDANISIDLLPLGTGNVNVPATGVCYTLNNDVFLCRAAAGNWRLGAGAAASPVAQTLSVQNASGTNIAGVTFTLQGSAGTGTGVGGDVLLQLAYPGATGSTLNTFSTVVTAKGVNNASSGRTSLVSVSPTINGSGTNAYDALLVNATETATGSGAKNLLALQLAAVDKFLVDDTGQISTGFLGARTDITMFYQAVTNCVDTSASTLAVPVRAAANDVSLQRTAAGAETHNFTCFLSTPTRTTSGKGWKLTAFSIVQQITVAALTSNTFNALATTTYVNNTADAVAAYGGAITVTPPTATQANPYVTAATVGTPAFMNTSAAGISADWTVVMQNTGVYSLKGVIATWTVQD